MIRKLSIHTATYNRAHTLPKVYESLCNQTCFDFDWFVTDNGSTDNTPELFEKWCKEETRFQIHYHQIAERGIPRAMNYGINHMQSDFFFMLDSDEKLISTGVSTILEALKTLPNDMLGVGFLKVTEDGKTFNGKNPLDFVRSIDGTNLDRKKMGYDTECCEAYRIKIIQKYPFPVWGNEIYAPEAICFNSMALDGFKIRWHNQGIVVTQYVEDGQTKGAWNLLKSNKMGYAMLSNQKLLYVEGFKNKFKEAAQHIALSIVAGYPSYIFKSNKPLITIVAMPYGLVLAVRRYLQFEK